MIDLVEHYPELASCMTEINRAGDLLLSGIRAGGKLLICGNGGSCADSEHIVGELMKSFLCLRTMPEKDAEKFRILYGKDAERFIQSLECGIPAMALSANALGTAFINDNEPTMLYAQQVYGYGRTGDILLAISTSGNSVNVVNAAMTAKVIGMKTVALTGAGESRLSRLCDCTIRVPATETYRIQEYHLPVYHYLCAFLENELYGGAPYDRL